MRVLLLMVTNAFFLASVVERLPLSYAGDKRVIIRVPQRIKHIYHHQVKKVPVYVLLPPDEKKSRVLDDLQRVTKTLPCKERGESESPPSWNDDIVDDIDPPLPKYRYARHYDALDASAAAAAASITGTARTISTKQREEETKRLAQMQTQTPPPPPTTFKRYKKVRQSVADYGNVDSDFSYNSEGSGPFDTLATNVGSRSSNSKSPAQRSKPSVFTYANKNKRKNKKVNDDDDDDQDEFTLFAASASASAGAETIASSGKFGHDGHKHDGSGSGGGRYARYYNAENGYKDDVNEIKASKLISVENGGGGGDHLGQNLIRISYPPTARAQAFSSTDSSSSSFYANDAAAYASSMAADAESHSSHNHRQHPLLQHPYQQPSASSQPQPPSAFAQSPSPTSANNNYASSYQYRVQH